MYRKRDIKKEWNIYLRYIKTSISNTYLKKDTKREWNIKQLKDKWYTLPNWNNMLPKLSLLNIQLDILLEFINNHTLQEFINHHIVHGEVTQEFTHHILTHHTPPKLVVCLMDKDIHSHNSIHNNLSIQSG